MSSIPVIVILLVFLGVVTVSIVFVYLVCYKRWVNKRLSNGQEQGKKMWSPLLVCLITVLAALTLFGVCTSVMASLANNRGEVESYYLNGEYYANCYTTEEMKTGYLSLYNRQDNPGYEKFTQKIGDITYTYFLSNQRHDGAHPDFIIFAEYNGNEEVRYSDAVCTFQTAENVEICGVGIGGSEETACICVVGSTSVNCKFSCSVDFYTEERDSLDYAKNEQNAFTLELTTESLD